MLSLRLSFGLMTLLVLLIAIGGYAISLFVQMGSAVGNVLEDNYKNVKAIHSTRVASSRINSTYVFQDWPAPLQADRSLFNESVDALNRDLQTLKVNIRDAETAKLVNRFEFAIRDYESCCGKIFLLRPDQGKDYAELRKQIGSSSLLITELGEQLLKLNEEVMFKSKRDAEDLSTDSIWFMLLAIAAAVVMALYTSYRLHSVIVTPIRTMTRLVQDVGETGSIQLLPVQSRDELGKLAVAFNEMTARVQAAYQTASTRISELDATIQTTLATFPDPIYVINTAGQLILRNPSGKNFSQELGLGDGIPLEIHDKAVEAARTGQDYTPTEFKDAHGYRIQDQKKYFLPRCIIMRNADRSVHGVAIVLQDITRFQLIDNLKTHLVSTVSHELKTPLTSIRMALHILSEQKIGGLNHDQWTMVSAAQEDSERLLRTLNNLLDISRMEGGFGELQLEAMQPRHLASSAVQDVERRATAKQIEIQLDVEPALPLVQVDRLQIAHVFRNLLTNAIKYSPPESSIIFRIRRRVRDPQVIRFSVIDQGPGIPSEYHASIFQKFFRVPDQKKSGAGLGLSIARQITEAHSGRVGVISRVGEGSEFFCDLPVAEVVMVEEPSESLSGSA